MAILDTIQKTQTFFTGVIERNGTGMENSVMIATP